LVSAGAGGVSGAEELGVLEAAESVAPESFLTKMTVATMAAITKTTPTLAPMMVKRRCLRAWAALRSSCLSSLRLAVARRCSLVGTAGVLLVVVDDAGSATSLSRHRVCQ
jgi:hypothetical protein